MKMKQNIRRQPMIVGRPALIMVDYQGGSANSENYIPGKEGGVPVDTIPEARLARQKRARAMVDAARAVNVPVIYIQEVHRADGIDFGRELDGDEDVHCLEGVPSTELNPAYGYRPGDYHIPKRRYSAFYGTDFEILLKGLKVETLILCGGLTDVCVHYTFVDGHQGNYFCRVVEDCVAPSSKAAGDAALNAMEYLQAGARRTAAEIIAAFEAMKVAA